MWKGHGDPLPNRPKLSTWWAIYKVVYVSGLLISAYMMRRLPLAFITLLTCFIFPIVLVAIAARADEAAFSVSIEPLADDRVVSLFPERQVVGIQREPRRPSTIVARTMLFPFALFVVPADPSLEQIKLILLLWWLGWAAIAAFVLPRLRASNPEHNKPGSVGSH